MKFCYIWPQIKKTSLFTVGEFVVLFKPLLAGCAHDAGMMNHGYFCFSLKEPDSCCASEEEDDGEEEEEVCSTERAGVDQQYDEHMDETAEEEGLKRYREARSHELFPDEVDTPMDTPARTRYCCGLCPANDRTITVHSFFVFPGSSATGAWKVSAPHRGTPWRTYLSTIHAFSSSRVSNALADASWLRLQLMTRERWC